MSFLYRDFLFALGWGDDFQQQYERFAESELIPARVVGEEKQFYRIQYADNRSLWASVSGKLRFETESRDKLPAVGDWVLCQVGEKTDRAVIKHILSRRSVLMRKQAGDTLGAQVIASNVDYFFVATSLNEELNSRRIERYLTVAWDSGVEPVIVLTKSDLVDNPEDPMLQLEAEFPAVRIFAVSIAKLDTLYPLKEFLSPGKTIVVVGSSGVGKSTLINHFVGADVMVTQPIREDDSKGRHTTTARHLLISRWGGLVIDTPGMRELQLMDHETGLQKSFEDIEELFSRCRFSNCQHDTEPACAIKQSLKTGILREERWESFLKLQKEIRFFQIKKDKALASAEKEKSKKVHKEQQRYYKFKRGQE